MQHRGDESPVHISEATRKKAEAAKSYIENMYKVQHQNIQDRLERCDQASRLWPVLTVCGTRQVGPTRLCSVGLCTYLFSHQTELATTCCTITLYWQCSVA